MVKDPYIKPAITDKWSTPKHIIENIEKKFGLIECDPASDNTNSVSTMLNYTIKEDGLKQKWIGFTFCNPPYGRGLLKWIEKAIQEFELGHTNHIILLLPSRTDTRWFHMLLEYKYANIEFIKGRLRYGDIAPAPFPSILVTIQKPLW